MDDFIYMGTRIGCRALELVGANDAKAALCAPGGEYRYLVGLGTWLLIIIVAGKIVELFFKPQTSQPNTKNE